VGSSILSDTGEAQLKKSMLIGMSLWMLVCLGNALNFPLIKLVKSPSSLLRTSWRMIALCIIQTPFALWDVHKNQHRIKYLFCVSNLLTIGFIAFCGFLWTIIPYLALSFTYSAHCTLFAGMPSVPLIAFKLLKR
jgi:hypothetical protein